MAEPEGQKAQETGRPRGKKFCPRCGSRDIFFARGLPQLWSIWECRDCGYYGAFIVEDGATSQKIREEWIKKHSVSNKPSLGN